MAHVLLDQIPRTNFQAIFGVHQNTPRLDEQINFYKAAASNWQFAKDDYQLKDGATLPDAWFTARGVKREDLDRFVAMRLPHDPYMHVYFYSWHNLSTKAQWPPIINQIGSRSLTFLLDDVDKELERIRRDFPQTPILSDVLTIERKWGTTRSALVKDPEGNFLELVSVAGGRFDEQKMKPAPWDQKTWLHFQMNCQYWGKTRRFYRGFGMEHDYGTDFRGEKIGFPFGWDYYEKQMNEGCDFKVDPDTRNDFLRNARDVSGMHLELLEGIPGREKPPGVPPTWSQLGIMRYCWRVPDYYKAVADIKKLGKKIYVEDQRGCLVWGDTQWIFYGDCDGNFLCQ
ncbi:hypothetical protein AYO21_10599 [Fonsecaea monophora]|uniref:VOC domain-containing protein n=1 Tax=Fonsecaea monophora TaxID=254056 RepID=A0A177EUU7_9EURO|nr:hypothetical protein AYO21_10599 [Fonsecaea monophora]OAG35201.1 hypothetical protein AYO21_10599 [Fonsecaea monophora]